MDYNKLHCAVSTSSVMLYSESGFSQYLAVPPEAHLRQDLVWLGTFELWTRTLRLPTQRTEHRRDIIALYLNNVHFRGFNV